MTISLSMRALHLHLKSWRARLRQGFAKQELLWHYTVLCLMLAGITVAALSYEAHTSHTLFHGIKKVEIAPGLGSRRIGALLKQEGIIRSKWAFVTYVALRNEAADLKPGTYTFSDRATITDIAKDLIAGAAELTLTIPEGWNTKEIGAYLDQQGITRKQDFDEITSPDATSTFSGKFSFLKERPERTGLEGYLFPDTYRFYAATPVEQVVAKMIQNFDAKFSNDLRQETFRQHRTIFEIVTMASLIEKEAAQDKDRELVSGILWKRMALDIPLQVDATIIFLASHKKKRVLYADTATDSPYNTYRYKGLPKGPIANPGLSAIRAALYPKKSPYLYYLSAPDGHIIFSRTLEEHNRAREKHLK